MDELEHHLRAGLDAEVGTWSPALHRVRRGAAPAAPRRRLQAALAAASVLVVLGGGIGVALGVGGKAEPRTSTLAAEPSQPPTTPSAAPSVVPSTSPTPCPDGVTVRSPGGDAPAGGPATSCVVPQAPATASAAASTSAGPPTGCTLSAPPTPRPDTGLQDTLTCDLGSAGAPEPSSTVSTPAAPACRPNDFSLSVRTGEPSYPVKSPVTITASLVAKRACDTVGDYRIAGFVTEGTAGGRNVEDFGGFCELHNGVVPKCPYLAPAPKTVRHWRAGDTESAGDTWSQVVMAAQAEPVYADPGDYVVTVAAGAVKASTRFSVTAPTCTPGQLTVALSADASSYAQGQTAHLTGTVTNTSTTACEAAVGDVQDPVATDSSGTTVWTDCEGTGDFEQPDGTCLNDLSLRSGSQLVAAGGQVALLRSQFTWDLGRTGSTTANPNPVPDGTYTVSWPELLRSGGSPASVAVTVTG